MISDAPFPLFFKRPQSLRMSEVWTGILLGPFSTAVSLLSHEKAVGLDPIKEKWRDESERSILFSFSYRAIILILGLRDRNGPAFLYRRKGQ